MRRLNQISRTYSFESTKLSIKFGACKMRRLTEPKLNKNSFFHNTAFQLLLIGKGEGLLKVFKEH